MTYVFLLAALWSFEPPATQPVRPPGQPPRPAAEPMPTLPPLPTTTAPGAPMWLANTAAVLEGVKSVHVHVELECEGRELDESTLKREAELELARAGIEIRPPLQADGVLYVYAHMARASEIATYGGSVGAEYLEVVTNRRGHEVAGGIVWHRRGSLITSERNLLPAIESALEGVRAFCRDHAKANE